MRVHISLAAVAAALLSLTPAVASAGQDVGPQVPQSGFNQGSFRFGTEARVALHTLWQSSIGAKAEEVACIGGYRQAGVSYITRVEQVAVASADSLHASATASLSSCKPPEWLGTVHTHIARLAGQPYSTFSGADRGVMAMWQNTWQAPGVFCVLYDERRTYCEAGDESSGEALYGYQRGNNLAE